MVQTEQTAYALESESRCSCEDWFLKCLNTDLNPLMPVPAVTGCDEHCPLFHFWCHQVWPKLASSRLKFCRRKRSFQLCPDQSDWVNGTWNMFGIAQKFKWKTWSIISFDYTWLQVLRGKNCPSRWFLGTFWTGRKPSRRPITAAKR